MKLKDAIPLFIAIALATVAALLLARSADASTTVTQVFNGGTGTSTTPSYGQFLIGGKNSEYELTSTSSFNLTTAAFASPNISQWTNNAGYLTSLAGAASSTALGDNNTWIGVNSFSNASSNFAGTWQSYSPSHFLTGNQTVTLSGAVSGSGTTAITTSYAGTLGNTLGGTGQNSSSWTGLAGINSGTWYAISTSSAVNLSISGNANTATTLQTARTINGVSFNGSANISVASTTLLTSDNNTFSGNTIFAASSTFQKQINAQQASTTQLSVSGNVYLTGLTAGVGNGSLCATAAGLLEYESGANCIAGGSGSVTQVNTTYPVQGGPVTTTGTISLAFGTTTANSWSALQLFNGGASTTALSIFNGLAVGQNSTTTISATGAITTPLYATSTFNGGFYDNASSTFTAETVGYDKTAGNYGQLTPMRCPSGTIASSTTWTATSSIMSVYGDSSGFVAPITGTVVTFAASTSAGTLEIEIQDGTHNFYYPASTTAGTYTESLSINKGDAVSVIGGNPASSPTFALFTLCAVQTP